MVERVKWRCPDCGQLYSVPKGKTNINCAVCEANNSSSVTDAEHPDLLSDSDGEIPTIRATSSAPETATQPTHFEYKVLTQKDRWFSGKFDPGQLEAALNAYAQEGWRVVTSATASIAGFGGSRDELLVILERPVS